MTVHLRSGPPISAELVRAADASTVALTIAEPASHESSWRLRLTAELGDGTRGVVGTIVTRGQAAAAGSPSRVIGTASCPGAVAWLVDAELVASNDTAPWAELGAAAVPCGVTKAEVVPNASQAIASQYTVAAGVGAAAPGTTESVPAGGRVLAVTATRSATAATNGTIVIGAETIQVPPGSALTIAPDGAMNGPLGITFTDVDGYVLELEV